MSTVRLELHAKNALLHRLVTANGHTVASFCAEHGITNQSLVGQYVKLQASPYRGRKPGEPSRLALKLSAIAQTLVEELFPPALYESLVEGPVVGEVSVDRFVALSAARHLALPPTQEVQVERGELRAHLLKAMTKLRPKEREVVRRYFGMDGKGEQSTEAIAAELDVTESRVNQIRARALRRLRHPMLSKPLRGHLEGRT